MQLVPIERDDDPRVADYRDLGDGARMRARGVFVAEGRFVVERLLASRRFAVRSLFVTESAARALGDAIAAGASDAPVYVATKSLLREVTGFRFHQGCLALGERPSEPTGLDSILSSASPWVVLEGVTHADNVGAIFRNAAAFGAGAVLLDPATVDPLYREAIRVSMAATLRVPFARATDWPADLARVRAAGFTLAALTPRTDATPLDALPALARVAWLVGAEGEGLSEAALAAADLRVRIPIAAGVDSLNVAAATAIALFATARRSATPVG